MTTLIKIIQELKVKDTESYLERHIKIGGTSEF
jgi:hypothetical protein